MTQPKKVKLSERAAQRLLEMIMDDHRYESGGKLPNENELSELLGVSRTTLREAISFLVVQGVLEIRRGRGTFVAKVLPHFPVDMTTLAALKSRSRAQDLFEMRLIFEPATVALACQRASDEELEQIRRKAEKMECLAAAGGDWPTADQDFHLSIIKASHNEYMSRLYPIINDAVSDLLNISANRQHMQEVAVADNRLIMDFLLRRDDDGARHAMSIHMRHLIHTLQV